MVNLTIMAAIVAGAQFLFPSGQTPEAQAASEMIETAPVSDCNVRFAAPADVQSKEKPAVTPSMSINDSNPWLFPPDGSEVREFYRTGECYYLLFGQVRYAVVDGQMASLVINDSEVWIYCPFAKGSIGCWIKGDLDKDGNVTVQTPQCIVFSTDQNTGNDIPMYLINIKEEIYEEGGESFATFVENTESSVIKYKWDGTSLTLTEGQLGLCFWYPDVDEKNEERWVWYGVADLKQGFGPCPYSPQTPPDGIKYEDFVLISDVPASVTGERTGQIIQVGFEGDDCWIKNLHPVLTDFYVKGTKTADGYVFKNQYLGRVDITGHHAFFKPGFYELDEYGMKAYGPLDEIYMTFDTQTNRYSSPDNQIWLVNAGNGEITYYQVNEHPVFYKYEESDKMPDPQNPVIEDFYPADMDNKIAGWLSVNLPQFSKAGEWIDTEYLTYNIFADDEMFIFSEENDYLDFMQPTDEIPYNLSNYDIASSGQLRMINIYRNDFSRIGIRLNCVKNGGRVSSDIVYVDNPSAGIMDASDRSKEVVETIYTNLSGQRTAGTEKGIYLKTVVYADGSRRTEKTVVLH